MSKADLYRHSAYQLPKLEVVASDIDGYQAAVLADGKVQARFKTRSSAENYVAFLRGERMRT